jgi:hypothetical protein
MLWDADRGAIKKRSNFDMSVGTAGRLIRLMHDVTVHGSYVTTEEPPIAIRTR